MIDYSRNWELNQNRIRKGKVTIAGCGAITNYLAFYMAGLGLRKVRILGKESGKLKNEFLCEDGKYKAKSIEEKIMMINDDMDVEALPVDAEKAFMGHPDVLVDASNSADVSGECIDHFYSNEKIKMLVNASSSRTYASSIFRRDKGMISKKYFNNKLDEYHDKSQGNFTSGLIAAVILDEIRKVVSPLEGDEGCKGRINYSLNAKFEDNPEESVMDKTRNVVVCGAGGIGTYVALNLALEGIKLDIFDGDSVESHNIARQIFYYDSIGRNKAVALQEKLMKLSGNYRIRGIPEYLEKGNLDYLENYDVIVCAADTWECRKMLNNYCVENKKMLINTGVTPFSAIAEAYIPGINNCLECTYDFEKLIGKKAQSCAEIQQTNVVMNNALIGAYVAGEIINNQGTDPRKFQYNSKKGNKKKFNMLKRKQWGNCKCTE